jgi:hypothetical protein
LPETTAAGLPVPGLVLGRDASIVICHSGKESATPTLKNSFVFSPLFRFLDNTREAQSGMLRGGGPDRTPPPTTSPSSTTRWRRFRPPPARLPGFYPVGLGRLRYGLLAHICDLRDTGVDTRVSVGVAITEPIRQAILAMKYRRPGDRAPALDGDGEPRDGADIYKLTGMIPDDGFPAGTRFIVRRERPHPGAQLSRFDTIEGLRHQVMATDTPPGQGPIQFLPRPHPRRGPYPHQPTTLINS